MGCSCGVVAELVEFYEGFGYWEDKWGVVPSGGVCVCPGGVKYSDLGDFR